MPTLSDITALREDLGQGVDADLLVLDTEFVDDRVENPTVSLVPLQPKRVSQHITIIDRQIQHDENFAQQIQHKVYDDGFETMILTLIQMSLNLSSRPTLKLSKKSFLVISMKTS